MNKKRWFIVAGSAAIVALTGMVIALVFIPRNVVVGSLNDREIRGQVAARRGPARFFSDGVTATVELGAHTARVTADAIELAGGRTVKIPPNCKKIELFETRKGLRILLDRAEQN